LEPLPHDKLLSKLVFSNYLKTIRDIEKVNRTKSVGVLIYNNLLAGHILVSAGVFEIRGSKNLKKYPHP